MVIYRHYTENSNFYAALIDTWKPWGPAFLQQFHRDEND